MQSLAGTGARVVLQLASGYVLACVTGAFTVLVVLSMGFSETFRGAVSHRVIGDTFAFSAIIGMIALPSYVVLRGMTEVLSVGMDLDFPKTSWWFALLGGVNAALVLLVVSDGMTVVARLAVLFAGLVAGWACYWGEKLGRRLAGASSTRGAVQ